EVIPIINLKRRFSLTENVKSHRIIIANNGIGFLVDDASKSMSKDEKSILAPPELGVGDSSSYISSIVIHEERLVLVIDLNSVVAADEIKRMIQ
ncbi:MAG: chemotaxis protein CheW, partial [Bacillota bacterium]|nr:chemotaxis protein CheW [Bacillota bacterium]